MTDIVLTLIHGTWAPHAPWTLPDSPLRKALASQLGDRIAFETLEWSGANTHRARREAAQKLRAQLADSIAANPLARHFLVAHSHGGNVALYAMADATLRQHIAGIACLNSPFICALKRNTKQFMLEIFAWMAAYFVLLFMAYAVFYVLAPLSTDPNLQHLGLLAQIGLGLGFAAVLILLIFFVIEPGLMYSRKLEDRVASWTATRRAGISQDIILPQNPDVPVLCAWTAGDEVISSFGLLDALANLPYLALSFIGLILSFVVIYGLQAFGILPSLFTVPTIDTLRSCSGTIPVELPDLNGYVHGSAARRAILCSGVREPVVSGTTDGHRLRQASRQPVRPLGLHGNTGDQQPYRIP